MIHNTFPFSCFNTSDRPIASPPADPAVSLTDAECQTAEAVCNALCRIREVTETNALDTNLAEQMLGLLQQQQQQQRRPIGEAKVPLESAALRDTTLDAKLSELKHLEEHDGDAHAKRVRPLSKLAQMMKRCLKEEKKIVAFALRIRWLSWVEHQW